MLRAELVLISQLKVGKKKRIFELFAGAKLKFLE